jgi:hypothetical protein
MSYAQFSKKPQASPAAIVEVAALPVSRRLPSMVGLSEAYPAELLGL